ncbi:hypothetical protein [Kineococcus arenarius]|uniref:hypothetical protein n=1 Tax=Kineococcus sp. SYSU DK007 TaxID=3383128 RepID=UPI003D7D7866
MRVLAPCPPAVPDLHAHARLHGTDHRTRDLLTELERSGLRGRGGASRLLGPELRRVHEEAGRTGTPAVVVVNGVEGEPLSRKDAHLLRTEPHLVLDGAQAVATAVGAADVVVCAPAGPVLAAVDAALAERRAARWPLDRVPVRTAASAPGFVAGQESALVAHLDGSAARPRGDGVPLARRGLAGRPTLVKNVETLAHAALVARQGRCGSARRGPPRTPGRCCSPSPCPTAHRTWWRSRTARRWRACCAPAAARGRWGSSWEVCTAAGCGRRTRPSP